MEWKFYTPSFEFKNDLKNYTWSGHINFAYDLVRNLKPKRLVELGTYKGTSFFAFSQGAKDENLETELVCVDIWQGDEQTDFYGKNVFDEFKETLAKYFEKQNINIKKMFFNDAAPSFESKSIDILHIDGLHTYKAVKEDYDTWKDKVTENGVIIFHDTKVKNFGVKDLWIEIQKENPEYTFVEFEHNYGLGIMFKDPKFKEMFTEKFKKEFIDHYFDISIEYRLLQRISELQNDLKDSNAGKENLDQMLRNVLKENEELYKKVESLESKVWEQKQILNKKAVQAVLKVLAVKGSKKKN